MDLKKINSVLFPFETSNALAVSLSNASNEILLVKWLRSIHVSFLTFAYAKTWLESICTTVNMLTCLISQSNRIQSTRCRCRCLNWMDTRNDLELWVGFMQIFLQIIQSFSHFIYHIKFEYCNKQKTIYPFQQFILHKIQIE